MSSTTKKRAKKLQTFKEEYSKKWKCIVSSKKSPNQLMNLNVQEGCKKTIAT